MTTHPLAVERLRAETASRYPDVDFRSPLPRDAFASGGLSALLGYTNEAGYVLYRDTLDAKPVGPARVVELLAHWSAGYDFGRGLLSAVRAEV